MTLKTKDFIQNWRTDQKEIPSTIRKFKQKNNNRRTHNFSAASLQFKYITPEKRTMKLHRVY